MAEEIRHPDGRIEHPSVRTEPSDASFGGIATIIVGALAIGVLIFFVVWAVFSHLRDSAAEAGKSNFPLASGPSTALPKEPRLEQIDRLQGVQTPNEYVRESRNLQTLQSYGPTTEDGFVHVPIDRAMQYLIDNKKLPARPEPPAEQGRRSGGLIDAGQSNSGRLFKEGPR